MTRRHHAKLLLPWSLLFLLSASFSSAADVDLVAHGASRFSAVGCAECHSVKKGDDAIKTGPNLFGLLQAPARQREIVEGEGENHRHQVTADMNYLLRSVRKPIAELAVYEDGEKKGESWLPVMPAYDKKVLSDFDAKAIFHYLRTHNDAGKGGPGKVMGKHRSVKSNLDPEETPSEILVTNRTRVYRARLAEASARAIAVGTKSGLNYLFDPRTLSIQHVWWGGFLNIFKETDGRAGGVSSFGHGAKSIVRAVSLLQPLHPDNGKKIDFSLTSPVAWDWKTAATALDDPTPIEERLAKIDANFSGYLHADTPVFFYDVGPNKLEVTFTADKNGRATLRVNGSLQKPQTFAIPPQFSNGIKEWTVTQVPSQLVLTLPKAPEKVWRPDPKKLKTSPAQQSVVRKPNDKVYVPEGYSAESLPAPRDPHGRAQLFEPLGMAFAKNGALIVTTRTAGVWKLHQEKWTQFAEGTIDAMSAIVMNDDASEIVIGQKFEVTRLRDEDGDGRADVYQTLTDDFFVSHNYHEYLHGPVLGPDGDFYFALNLGHYMSGKKDLEGSFKGGGAYMGTFGAFRGWALKVSPEGKQSRVAAGLRSPAGIAFSPDGTLFYADNQGSFMGTSKLFELKKDAFYGYPASLINLPGVTRDSKSITWDETKDAREFATALFPHSRLSNSPGSPAWDTTKGGFGVFSGQMFVGDQTLSNFWRTIPKKGHEAVSIPFGSGFPSGVMRLCFAPDGSLYVGQTGRGWRSRGGQEAALVQVRHTGKNTEPELYDVIRTGSTYHFLFTKPLAKAPQKVEVRSWHYQDSPKYGSPEHAKATVKVSDLVWDKADPRVVSVTIEPKEDQGRQVVYHFYSDSLPANTPKIGNTPARMEAFFTRTPEKNLQSKKAIKIVRN